MFSAFLKIAVITFLPFFFEYCSIVTSIVTYVVLCSLVFLFSGPNRAAPKGYYNSKRRFLVTGSGSGIGKHITGAVLRRGHKVIATDINVDAIRKASVEENWSEYTKEDDDLIIQKLDVSSREQWKKVFDVADNTWGGIDVVMNIAGYLYPGKVGQLRERDIDLHVDVNLKGVIHGTDEAAKRMLQQSPPGGHIINVSSLGALSPVSGVSLYIGSKFGCRGLTLCANKDLDGTPVYVSCLLPDAVQTPMVDLQQKFSDSAMAFSGGILTVNDIENCIFDRILPERLVEVLLPSSPERGWGAYLCDIFHDSRLVRLIENSMRQKGIQRQQELNK